MYCKSESVCPWRPINRPESSVLTSSNKPSSISCASTVVEKPSRLRIFSNVSLGSAAIVLIRVQGYDEVLFLLFLRRRQSRTLGRRGRRFRRGFRQFRLDDGQ